MRGKPNNILIAFLSIAIIVLTSTAVALTPSKSVNDMSNISNMGFKASEMAEIHSINSSMVKTVPIKISTENGTSESITELPADLTGITINVRSDIQQPITRFITLRDTVYVNHVRPFEPFMRPISGKSLVANTSVERDDLKSVKTSLNGFKVVVPN